MFRPRRPLPNQTISLLCRCWALARPLSAALRSASAFLRPLSQRCVVLTPFPATLTGHRQFAENTTALSPAFATLTARAKVNPFVCHSYRKHPGSHLSSQISFRSDSSRSNFLPTRHPPPATFPFRIRTSEKRVRNSFRIRTYKTQDLKPFRMNTYKKTGGGGPYLLVERLLSPRQPAGCEIFHGEERSVSRKRKRAR